MASGIGRVIAVINIIAIRAPRLSAIIYFCQDNFHENKLLAYDQDLLLLLHMHDMTMRVFSYPFYSPYFLLALNRMSALP